MTPFYHFFPLPSQKLSVQVEKYHLSFNLHSPSCGNFGVTLEFQNTEPLKRAVEWGPEALSQEHQCLSDSFKDPEFHVEASALWHLQTLSPKAHLDWHWYPVTGLLLITTSRCPWRSACGILKWAEWEMCRLKGTFSCDLYKFKWWCGGHSDGQFVLGILSSFLLLLDAVRLTGVEVNGKKLS